MATIYKFGTPGPEEREWTWGDVWSTEEIIGDGSRLVIAPAQGQIAILAALLKNMLGPFWVLYVLVISRGQGQPGRYQSAEPQTEAAAGIFLKRFSRFFEMDARHSVWIASASGPERLIYDRHNVIYAYGPLASWKLAVTAEGLTEVPAIQVPSPHSHHYHEGLDLDEDQLLDYWDWLRTPLKRSDKD